MSHRTIHNWGSGAVVLAAYNPDPHLFSAQLRSIQRQSYADFVCLVGADGGVDDIRALVHSSVGGDQRFVVVGWDDNVGFYLNFERLLQKVPSYCRWVALSDHDDRWLDDKLERLLPVLVDAELVSGQARVVESGTERIIEPKTHRTVVTCSALLLQNQVSGAMCIFRRELLEVALPFPRLNTVTQLHDHWLAMCAVAVGRYAVVDEVVQDYVQHGNNVIGEVAATVPRWTPISVLRRVRELARQYEGGSNPKQCLHVAQQLSFGWRRTMIQALDERVEPRPPWLSELRSWVTGGRLGIFGLLSFALRSPEVAASVTATFVAGLPGELLWRPSAYAFTAPAPPKRQDVAR